MAEETSHLQQVVASSTPAMSEWLYLGQAK